MLSIGLAGKPNSGKSTFFKAATQAEVEIANYPFTTIDANHGVSSVRVPCPCKELGIKEGCGRCKDGHRFIAIELIDVAGLVPDAHLGKGLGNEFLDALRVAEAVIHVLDASGGTDAEGNPVGLANHDPVTSRDRSIPGDRPRHTPQGAPARYERVGQGRQAMHVALPASHGVCSLTVPPERERGVTQHVNTDSP